ncbi:MAG: tetratricopeptide repeat protein [Bacteroidota bacterium]
MRIFIILIGLLSFLTLSSAQVLNGMILDGLEEDKGLPNVRIRVSGSSSLVTDNTSDSFGIFSISLLGEKRGASIKLHLIKEGYAVINRESLKPRIPDSDSDQLDIYMCPRSQRDKLAAQFYGIKTLENIQRNYEAEAKVLADNMNYEAIAELTRKKEIAEKNVDSLAARLARFDPENSSEELTRAMQLYQQGKITDALQILDVDKIIARIEAKREVIGALESSIEQDVEALLSAADIALTSFQFEKAQTYYEKAVEADPANFENLNTLCLFLLDQNQSQTLLRYAENLLQIAVGAKEKAIALGFLGSASEEQDIYSKAIKAFKEANDIWKTLAKEKPEKYNNYVAGTLNNLGVAFKNINRHQEAITSYHEALGIYETLAKNNPQKYESDVAMSLNNLGNAYTDLNQYSEAISLFTKALGIRRRLGRENPDKYEPDIASTLNNLGIVYTDLNLYSKALEAYGESLVIRRRLTQENPQKYEAIMANTLNNLGITYTELHRYADAVTTYKEALEISRKLAEENPQKYEPDVAMTLNNLGNVYQFLQVDSEIVPAYEEALRIRQKLANENPQKYASDVAVTLNNLGIAYEDLERYSEAITTHEKALDIRLRLANDNPQKYEPAVAMSYFNLGIAYENIKRYPDAITTYKEAIGIYRRLAEENGQKYHPNLANSLNTLGNTYNYLSRYSEVIPAYKEALEIYKALAMENPQQYKGDVAMILNNLGVTFKYLERYPEAVKAYEEAIGIREELAKNKPALFSATLGSTYYRLGDVYRKMLLLPQALTQYIKSDSVYKLAKEGKLVKKRQQQVQERIQELSRIDAYGNALNEKGWKFYQQSKLDSAKVYFTRAQLAYDTIPENSLDIEGHYNLSLLYERLSYVGGDQANNYAFHKKVVSHRQKVAEAHPENADVVSGLALAYYNLSWYALFAGDYLESEQSARKALELSPESTGVISNLATALLFQGKYQEANSLFREWKDKAWVDDRYDTYGEAFLSDLAELEQAGITHPDVVRVRELLAGD